MNNYHNREPEIFDFRDTWLREIALYQDHVKAHQLYAHNHRNNAYKEPYSQSIRNITERDKGGLDENHRDANFAQIDNPNGLPLTTVPKIVVNPYHAKLVQSQKDAVKTSTIPQNKPILEAHTILENIHRTLKVKFQLQQDAQIEKPLEETIAAIVPTPTVVEEAQSAVAGEVQPAVAATLPTAAIPPPNNDKDNQSLIDNNDSGDSALEDDLDFIDDDELAVSSSDSENEYKGHVYLCDAIDEITSLTDDTSLENSESPNFHTPSSLLMPSLFPHVPPYITFSSHFEKGPAIPPELQHIMKWKMTSVMPKIVRYIVINTGFRLLRKTNDWMGTWDKHMKSPAFKDIRSHQKFNHLPGSFKIGRKDSIWRNLKLHINKHGKKEFGFMRRTFVLPQDLPQLKRAWMKYSKLKTKWIIKPPASARGFGVKLISKWAEIPQNQSVILQKYIERPFLINGNKFDLRLYVLITSVNPLRIFIHNEGLVRFASVQYSDKMETIHDRCMHLTNYSVNKLSSNYIKNENINECTGHKWTLKSLWSYLRDRKINTKLLWGTIRNLVVRTILVGENGIGRIIQKNVGSKYSCFELFGFDVLLDENLTPWLLEVNISPSLHIELPLDKHVKGPLVQAVLNTVSYQVPPKLSRQQQKDILAQYNLSSPLCFDKRLYVTALSSVEAAKHNRFMSKSIVSREDYLDKILDDLTPDDIRCLIISEDELARSSPMERIFPGPNSYTFLQFIDQPRYYNRLLDAWETRYASNRDEGIKYLRTLCAAGIHLRVTQSALLVQPDQELEDDDDEEDEINPNDILKKLATKKLVDNDKLTEIKEKLAKI